MTVITAAIASSSNSSSLSDVEPGLLGFLVVAGIGVALIFLLRSMNKQFRKLGPPPPPESRPERPDPDQPDPDREDTPQDAGHAHAADTGRT